MNRLLKLIIISFVILFTGFNSMTQAVYNPNKKQNQIDQLLSKYNSYDQFNGSVLVAHEGKVVYTNGFGMANFEFETPNLPSTKHRIASVSKQFTAMLIIQLVAENKLDLHSPISKYLPDYPKERADKITIHHLLTHTSGTVNYTNFSNYRDIMRTQLSPDQLVELFADSALIFKPGDRIYYSNSGYTLLGVIIEKLRGKSYGEVIQEMIFEPLGMKNSGYDIQPTVLKNRASGYFWRGPQLQNANFIDMSVAFSAGGLYSSVEDLYLWDQALHTEKLLPKKYIKLLFEDHFPMYGGAFYGYGWELEDVLIGSSDVKKEAVSHSGVINGFTSLITRFPDTKSSVILLNNTSKAPLGHITKAISGILYDLPYDMPKRSVAKLLLKKVNEEGIDQGISFFKEMKNSKEHYINEGELNDTGYALLSQGKAKEAKVIFELIIENYPNSFNAYDSYAESLMGLGDKEKAIFNYKKSLEMNPNNKNAKEMLKKIEK